MSNFFSKDASLSYDEKNKGLVPIADNMHFLIRLILKDLPVDARILCVGVGTGAEILSLALEYPGWTFVGIDPSEGMLQVCQKNLEEAGIMNRCELIEGYVQDVQKGEQFDATLSILVGHFVKNEEKKSFYQNMYERLKTNGLLVDTEISFDLDSEEFPSMFKNWAKVQKLMGATEESLNRLPDAFKNVLSVLPNSEVEDIIRSSGFSLPVKFFQAFMITGWYAKK